MVVVNGTEELCVEAINAEGNGLQVVFFRAGARWAHCVIGWEAGDPIPLFESLEGDDQTPFPLSPALQQIATHQQFGGTSVLLMLGMAGQNHWSVSVEAESEKPRVRFDVACRHPAGQLGDLGSSYRLLAAPTYDEQECRVEMERHHCVLSAVTGVGHNDALLEQLPDGSAKLRAAIDTSLTTQRWCYEFAQREG